MPVHTVQMDNHFRQDSVIRADAVEAIENRTIEGIVFSTGQRGLRYDWYTGEQYYEELEISTNAIRTERLEKGLSVIDNHRSWDGIDGVFGVTERYAIESGEIVGDVRFADDDDSDKKFQKVKSRVLRHVSLGYKVHRMMYVGDNAEDGIPIYRAVDWEPTELSFTPVSFETTNGVRSDNNDQPQNSYRCEIETENDDMNRLPFKLMARGGYQVPADDNGGSPTPAAPTQEPTASNRNEPTPAPAAPAEPQAPAGTTRTEQTPAPAAPVVTEQQSRAATAEEFGKFMTYGRKCGIDDEVIKKHFERGDTLVQFREFALDQLADEHETKIHGRSRGEQQDQGEQQRAAAVQYLMNRGAQGNNVPKLDDMSRQFLGMKLMDMARHFTGTGFGQSVMAQAGRAFETTSDFALILENVMHKTLQAGYEETERTFLGIPMVQNASDFREHNVYRMGDAPNLKKLKEDGEYESGTFGSEKETFVIDTYARKIGVTRQTLINDDMNALAILPYMFGQAGSRLESDLFWGMVLNYDFQNQKVANFTMRDGKHLFDADHNNLLTGASSALSKTSLSNMRKLGRKQKTVDKNFMNVQFNTFVFSEDLETTAEDLLVNTLYPNTPENINTFRGKHEMRIEPRIAQVSADAWLGFSNQIKAFVISYLDGEEGMYSEAVQSTDRDGITFKARKDFGVGMVDHRGAAKSNGK